VNTPLASAAEQLASASATAQGEGAAGGVAAQGAFSLTGAHRQLVFGRVGCTSDVGDSSDGTASIITDPHTPNQHRHHEQQAQVGAPREREAQSAAAGYSCRSRPEGLLEPSAAVKPDASASAASSAADVIPTVTPAAAGAVRLQGNGRHKAPGKRAEAASRGALRGYIRRSAGCGACCCPPAGRCRRPSPTGRMTRPVSCSQAGPALQQLQMGAGCTLTVSHCSQSMRPDIIRRSWQGCTAQ